LEVGKYFHYLCSIKNNQKYLEMIVSDKAIELIKGNNKLMGRLMIAFDRGQNTIENWMASKDIRLTTPTAVQILKEETGLTEEEILEEGEPATAK
jgi:hypothetical protein